MQVQVLSPALTEKSRYIDGCFCKPLYIGIFCCFYMKYYCKARCCLKATPHKARLMTLYVINLYLFRHLAQKFFAIRQYACKISVQSDEKSNCVSAAQSLCDVALICFIVFVFQIKGMIHRTASAAKVKHIG